MTSPSLAAVIVLAAGEGTRMKSSRPKVLHELCGRSMLGHVVAASRALDPGRLIVVVGHGRDQVIEHLAGFDPDAEPVIQAEQHGTGHAVRVALEQSGELDGTVLVVGGDAPLLTTGTLFELAAIHQRDGNAVTVLSAEVPDPQGYGRIVRTIDGAVTAIVEQRDTTLEQSAVREINSSVYAFDAKLLREALTRISRDNAQGEEYLTDVLAILAADHHKVDAYVAEDYHEILGANDRAQLAELRRMLNTRIVNRWMRDGVSVIDPATTWVDVQVVLERDVTLLPQTQLEGATRVASGAEVGPNCTIRDTSIGEGARVFYAYCQDAEIGPEASVGPFTYLRPGTRLARKSKAGGFVETKNAVVGEGAKVPHLSYVGDAEIGAGTNIGAATVFVNYDGVNKHRTKIGEHVFIGSDTMLIAPVEVGDGAQTAAGSVINQDVPPGSLGVARARQRNIDGWVERKRPGSAAARAARAASAESAGDTPDAGDDRVGRGDQDVNGGRPDGEGGATGGAGI